MGMLRLARLEIFSFNRGREPFIAISKPVFRQAF
jgi:hypothetical protein